MLLGFGGKFKELPSLFDQRYTKNLLKLDQDHLAWLLGLKDPICTHEIDFKKSRKASTKIKLLEEIPKAKAAAPINHLHDHTQPCTVSQGFNSNETL